MAISAQSIVTQAWIDLGVGAPGDLMPASEASNALVKLNMMLDSFSAARDLIYEILTRIFTLTNAISFPIGSTAAPPFNVERPVKIENAQIQITLGSGRVLTYPVEIISQSKWQNIIDKQAQGTIPEHLYYDPQVPNAVINLHPIPLCTDVTYLDISVWTFIPQFASLATTTNLPPAYLRLINTGLQLELIPTYGRLVSPAIVQMRSQQFAESLAVVRALNSALQMEPLGPASTSVPQQMAAQQAAQKQG